MSGDLNDLLHEGSEMGLLDLASIPMTCEVCPDVETHVRLTTAARADDAADLELVMQMLGLLDSPAPRAATTNGWGSRRPRRGKRHHHKEDH